MPYADLYKRLEERTVGRIVRGDGDIAAEKSKFERSGDPLWVELSLKA